MLFQMRPTLLDATIFGSLLISAFNSGHVLAAPVTSNPINSLSTVYESPSGLWFENLAARSNGNLLLQSLSSPEIHEINPLGGNSNNTLVHRFGDGLALMGIAEISPDVFAVAVGKFDIPTVTPGPGSFSVWKIKFGGNASPEVTKITDIPEAGLLNGLAILPHSPAVILVSDSKLGGIWNIDATTGAYKLTLQDDTMKPAESGTYIIGINGIRTNVKGFVYYTSFNQGLLCRIPITPTGVARGPVQVLASNITGADDFALSEDGTAYVAQNPASTLWKVTPDATAYPIEGATNSTLLTGVTSAQFGRTWRDSKTLYISTGTGKIVALDV